MKLNVLFDSLIGKELTAANVQVISQEIDAIKARATEKVQTELDKVKVDLEKSNTKVSTFENAEKDVALKAAFIKAGGNPKKYESFKKVSGEVKDVEKFDFKETFKEFSGLNAKGNSGDEDDDEGDFKGGDISGQQGDGDDENGDGGDDEGSLIA